MNPSKLFLRLSTEDRDIATEIIKSISIGYSAGILYFRESFKAITFKYIGIILRELFKYLSRLDKSNQDNLFNVIG